MKLTTMLAVALLGLTTTVVPAIAQTRMHHHKRHIKKHSMPAHPKNEVTKLEKVRKKDRTVKQVTPDPKKSPGKHADNLSKNVNHELNRESKDINHVLSGKK